MVQTKILVIVQRYTQGWPVINEDCDFRRTKGKHYPAILDAYRFHFTDEVRSQLPTISYQLIVNSTSLATDRKRSDRFL